MHKSLPVLWLLSAEPPLLRHHFSVFIGNGRALHTSVPGPQTAHGTSMCRGVFDREIAFETSCGFETRSSLSCGKGLLPAQ